MSEPLPHLEAFLATGLRLQQLAADVGDAQWRAGKTPVAREDTTERSKGLTSDPVPTIVTDARRVALRQAMLEADRALVKVGRLMQAAEHHLTDALTKWQG
jgi:hypothetical protein